MKQFKTIKGIWNQVLFTVQGYFSGEWEDIACSAEKSEAISDLKAYRENDPTHSYRLKRQHEPMDEEPTKVVYRMLEGKPIAIFPELPANPGMMQSYMSLGQHSECARNITSFTEPAMYTRTKIFSEPVRALHAELESLGYNLYPVERMPSR